jgi:hypothetical protein
MSFAKLFGVFLSTLFDTRWAPKSDTNFYAAITLTCWYVWEGNGNCFGGYQRCKQHRHNH